jgi:hypothetical protein
MQEDGSQRAAEYVVEPSRVPGSAGRPGVIVVYPDTESGEAVEMDRVIPRETEEG